MQLNALNPLSDSKNEKDTFEAAPTPERLKKQERILILTADDTQDLEFFYPYYRLNEEGYRVDVATPKGGSFKGKMGMGLKETLSMDQVQAADYSLLYIPGGKAPATLRKDDKVIQFVKQFASSGKPIAAICHGPQVLVTADVIRGKKISAYSEVAKELQEAGATYSDEALAIDGQFITARVPGDLPRHLCGVIDVLQGRSSKKAAA
ncbi:MAG: type 1 glutamine amidotransferase domain-containing protein [Rickettsiales bacterium]